jgi:decaprenyl-phosphate phosphoribosyltransferase
MKSTFVKLCHLIRLLRPHHWIKNGFVVIPAFFAGQAFEARVFFPVVGATLIFCLLASAIYIINDLRDIDADRQHAKKKYRPLPAGLISQTTALITLAALLGLVAGLLYWLQPPMGFLAIITAYICLNLAYSLGLKQLALVEIFFVSSGYILRLVAGALIVHEHLTSWILACTGLISLLLTVGKRRGDMAQNNDHDQHRQSLKKYSIPYLDHLMTMLAATTIVTYLLFTMSDYAQTRFGESVILSTVFVIFGIMRYLQIVMVESGGDQPTTLLYRDRWMIATVLGYLFYFVLTLYAFR